MNADKRTTYPYPAPVIDVVKKEPRIAYCAPVDDPHKSDGRKAPD
ncbi:MAG: hypothetical protein OJF49_004379 [Ktedonobacterales bacterium]|nr:MAG: hypothetical protein OJF49_004379 [Ktedonobacterales bacterium]